MLNESIPTASARTASSTVLRMTTSPLSGCPDSSTVTKANVSNPNSISWLVIASSSPQSLSGPARCATKARGPVRSTGPSSHGPLGGKRAAWSALRLEQLKVELDLHDIAKDDAADAGRHGEVDAEVLAADLGRGFEAGVAGAAARDALDTAELHGEDNRAGDVADREIAVDLILDSGARDPRGAEHHGRALGDVEDVGRQHVRVAVGVGRVDRCHVDGRVDGGGVEGLADDDVGLETGEAPAHFGNAEVADGEPDRGVVGVDRPVVRGQRARTGGGCGGHGRIIRSTRPAEKA